LKGRREREEGGGEREGIDCEEAAQIILAREHLFFNFFFLGTCG
jgi:hypothetical protein